MRAKWPNDPSSPTPPAEASPCNQTDPAAFGAAPLLGEANTRKIYPIKFLYPLNGLMCEGEMKVPVLKYLK